MHRLIALVCLAAACLGSPLPDGKIVGGSSVKIEDYPHQLSLLKNGLHDCGASIISPNWALTAAHCIKDSTAIFTIRAGSSIRESNGTVYKVSELISHKLYNLVSHDYDIALLKVSTPFTLGPAVGEVDLPKQNDPVATDASSVVTGWGKTSEGGSLSSQLQAVSIRIVSQSACQEAYGSSNITSNMFCAGVPEGGKDACQGDSGGPLVSGGKQVGIVSWGKGCARVGYPTVYTRVAELRDWIKEKSGV